MLLRVVLSAWSVLAHAAAADTPVLLDFEAPWCYSCYFMNQHVLSQEGFRGRSGAFSLKKVDVDTPEGRALKAKHTVTFLPSYVLLGRDGKERGRIIGEQNEVDFLAKLDALLGGTSAVEAAAEKLRAKLAKGDVEALKALLKTVSCETPYDVMKGETFVEKLYPEHRKLILTLERGALESLAGSKLFVERRQGCADFRSGVEALAAVYDTMGLKEEREKLLGRAIAQVEGWAKTGEDRNRDDNLRFFLERAGEDKRLREHFNALIAAYPSDYVYAYRFGRYLHERGEHPEALGFVEKADKLCYGANRLAVTKFRAKILAALGRKDEALALLKRDAKTGRSAFPVEAADLEKLAAELAKAG